MFYLINFYHHKEKKYLAQLLMLISHQYPYTLIFVLLPANRVSKLEGAFIVSGSFGMFFVEITISANSTGKLLFKLNLLS